MIRAWSWPSVYLRFWNRPEPVDAVAELSGPSRLLEQAICYTLTSMDGVVAGFGPLPTPCEGWDLRSLLLHLNDAAGALQEAAEFGLVDPPTTDDDGGDPAQDLVAAFRSRAPQLLQSCAMAVQRDHRIAVGGGCTMTPGLLTVTAAVEVAVHGWDISVACGNHRPIPPALALGMLALSQLIIDERTRQALFDAPVPVSALASPSDQLVAFLGRHPIR
jgi:uncharacterized protein (TIGR03086 family)